MPEMAKAQPQPEHLGYEASLDLGVNALENGLTSIALPYLRQATERRPTRFALVQLAKAHRDLGQARAARDCLLRARRLPDGENSYVLVSLAAALCDLSEYGTALEVATEAVELDPDHGPALAVLSRCMREAATSLGKHSHIDQSALAEVHRNADDFAERAKESDPDGVFDLQERRRKRASQWGMAIPAPSAVSPVEQTPAAILDQARPSAQDSPSAQQDDAVIVPIDDPAEARARWWRRGLRRLRSLLGH
jgi:tetratricopeptide (TPR) repeat protein